MGENKVYTTVSLYPEVANKIVDLKKDLNLKNNSDSVKVLLAAYDILNNTGYGGGFTEAVKQVMEID